MRPSLFLFQCLVPFLVIFFTSTGFCKDKGDSQTQISSIPPLMESIRFSKEIKFCGIKIPHDVPHVKQMLEKEILLALWSRPQVILWMKRSGKYFPEIEKILKQENLPLDLKYVPVIESALRPHSRSSKGAVGYWQFLKSTGKRYGLRIDSKIDERRNIFKSTMAASLYLKKLNNEFGSYLLALSAYNMGEFGLHTEIEAQETKDYFFLYLPLETQRYVFKMIAAKLIMEAPEKYGFFLQPSDLYPALRFSKINFNLNQEIPLVVIAQAAGITFKTIKEINPEIRGYHLGSGKMTILVPEGKEKGFKERFSEMYERGQKKYKTKFHVVKPGESLTGIAQHYNMSLPSLLRLNKISFKTLIHPGDRLVVR